MKRKVIIVALALALLAAPAFAQFRLDVGFDVPVAAGVWDGTHYHGGGTVIDSLGIIPIPDVGLSFRVPLGPFRIGAGVRLFTAIVQTLAYPNIYGEVNLGPFVIQTQLGGLAIGTFGVLGTAFEAGLNVLIPDVSLWVALGKNRNFRIGAGAMGIGGVTLLSSGFLIMYYGGFKVVLNP